MPFPARTAILVILLLLPGFVRAAGVLVIGDSLAAQSNSWPNLLRDRTGLNVMVMAQNGRTIRDFEVPRDLHKDGNITTVIYSLGSNDAFQGTPARVLKEQMKAQLRFLKDRGFRVLVVIPYPYPFFAAQMEPVIAMLKSLAGSLRLETIDVASVWDTGLTYDSVHPTAALSSRVADHIALYLTGA